MKLSHNLSVHVDQASRQIKVPEVNLKLNLVRWKEEVQNNNYLFIYSVFFSSALSSVLSMYMPWNEIVFSTLYSDTYMNTYTFEVL